MCLIDHMNPNLLVPAFGDPYLRYMVTIDQDCVISVGLIEGCLSFISVMPVPSPFCLSPTLSFSLFLLFLMSACILAYPSIHPSIHPSCPSVHPSICPETDLQTLLCGGNIRIQILLR